MTALKQLGFTHMSSQIELDPPPYPMSGQSFYRFPEGAAPDDESLVGVLPYYVGIPATQTIIQIQNQIASYGYAVGKFVHSFNIDSHSSHVTSYALRKHSKQCKCRCSKCNNDYPIGITHQHDPRFRIRARTYRQT